MNVGLREDRIVCREEPTKILSKMLEPPLILCATFERLKALFARINPLLTCSHIAQSTCTGSCTSMSGSTTILGRMLAVMAPAGQRAPYSDAKRAHHPIICAAWSLCPVFAFDRA